MHASKRIPFLSFDSFLVLFCHTVWLRTYGLPSLLRREDIPDKESIQINQSDQFESQMRSKLDTMFNHQTKTSGHVEVRFASPGSWHPSPNCETPLLWVFLQGQYRSFDYTKKNLLQMAKLSSGNCYFVAAIMPEEPCNGSSQGKANADHPSHCGDNGTLAKVDVYKSLIDTQRDIFDGRMAYAIVTRTGLYNRPFPENEHWNDTFVPSSPQTKRQKELLSLTTSHSMGANNLQGTFDFYWYSVYMCAALAANVHGFTPLPHSVVLRTRPDVDVLNKFDFVNLMKYFREGQRGYHLMFGGETFRRQADCYMITSFQAYKTNIAEAYEHSVWTARNNGAGYGWSICGWRSPCSIEQAEGKVWIYGPEADNPALCKTRPLNYTEKDCCSGGSCAMTVVENRKLGYWPIIRQYGNNDRAENHHFNNLTKIDLAYGNHLVCPSYHAGFVKPESWGGDKVPLYGRNEDHQAIEEGRAPFPVDKVDRKFYTSTEVFDLVQDDQVHEVWPDGC